MPAGTRAKRPRPRSKRPSSILIVGDEVETSRAYARSFAAHGYLVDLAADCDTALRLTETKRFDAVVTDLDLPGAPAEKLKGLRQRHGHIALVMLSSRLAFASAQVAVDCGADRYLLKPVSGERLLAALTAALAESSHDRGKE